MKRRIGVMVFALALSGCAVSKNRAIEAAYASGLDDVEPSGLAFAACSNGDYPLGRTVTATNAAGVSVRAVVCCGVWKACTVRFGR